MSMDRRDFLRGIGGVVAASALPMTWIKVAFADSSQDFSFAYLSDSHLQHIKGSKFVRNWDQGLIRAVAETNLLNPQPDFVVYGGDLAQNGRAEETDHGMEILSALRLKGKLHFVMGEHDYYYDLGEHWEKLHGPQWYSFDHKGVHFIVLNSILTHDDWTHHRWPSAAERMNQMAVLDNPNGSPFLVGEKQRAWMQKDLDKVSKDTPIIVLSHSPLQHIFRNWNFWTEDAAQIQAMLAPYKKVNVLYGHVHQIQYNQIGNISFNSVMSTAWPWPYPQAYSRAPNAMPVLTVPMDRADPFFERDGTGWQFIDVHNGRLAENLYLWSNKNRVVAFNEHTGRPEDEGFQDSNRRIAAQNNY
jgi:hypothetical protein